MPDPENLEDPSWWRARVEEVRAVVPVRWTARFSLAALFAVVGVATVIVAGAWLVLRSPPAPAPIELPRAGAPGAPGAPPAEGGAAGAPTTGDTSATITVAAAGAVVRPGVYVVPAKSRVADVVTVAGGTLPEADLDQVNLAAKVADAERVFVPRKGETVPALVGGGATGGSAAPGGSKESPLDLNTATAEQLDTLPGVGPATAQAIVSYRSDHGRFKSVNELLEVRGIGPAKFETLRTLVRVS